jgi:hypothetical protein
MNSTDQKPDSSDQKPDRVIDIFIQLIKRCNIIIALIIFVLIILLLSDFMSTHLLLPLGLAEMNGMGISPTQEGYLAIAGSVAVIYMIADMIYKSVS